jgi:ribosomal protein S18 acetylase RimI-like enzyme
MRLVIKPNRKILELEETLLAAEMWYEKLLDWDIDRRTRNIYTKATEYDYYSTLDEHWALSSIAVSKRFQKMGVGKELMTWGINISQKNNLPLVLNTSIAGRRMYNVLDFSVVEVRKIEELGLEGVVMARIV